MSLTRWLSGKTSKFVKEENGKMLKRTLCLLLALLMVFALVACGQKEEAPAAKEEETKTEAPKEEAKEEAATEEKEEAPAEDAAYAEEVVIGINKDVDTLNPMQSSSTIEGQMVYYCTHETLVYLDPETRELTGDIAESWDLSEDGLTYTFYLKKGIKFHNGEELKASDVKFSLERCAESATQKSRVALMESVEVIDDYTVEIKLSKVFLDFLYNLSQPNVSIVSEKAVTEMGDDGEKIGCGPYMNEEY